MCGSWGTRSMEALTQALFLYHPMGAREFLAWTFGENDAHFKGSDDIWRFLGRHDKKRRKVGFWGSGVVHSWVRGCLVRMGKTQILSNFALMYFEEGQIVKKFVCVGAENTLYFLICRQKWKKYSFAPVSVWWAQISRKCVSCWGHVGLVVLFFFLFFWATSLGPRPSLFLLVCFWFWGCFWGLFLFWE